MQVEHCYLPSSVTFSSMRRYCIRAALFVFNYELPEFVQACPGEWELGI